MQQNIGPDQTLHTGLGSASSKAVTFALGRDMITLVAGQALKKTKKKKKYSREREKGATNKFI